MAPTSGIAFRFQRTSESSVRIRQIEKYIVCEVVFFDSLETDSEQCAVQFTVQMLLKKTLSFLDVFVFCYNAPL